MTLMEYAIYLYNRVCDVAEVYNEFFLKDIFIVGVDFSACHRVKEYWAPNPLADVTSIVTKTQPLLEVQKDNTKQPCIANQIENAKQLGKRSWNNKATNILDTGSTGIQTGST